ncbi:MAG: twin-arginine translocase subunit TatC, partial [Planctomycetota bacterium]
GEHLEELRKRLVYCLLATALGFGVALWFLQPIMDFLKLPLEGLASVQIVQTRAYDAFMASMKVAFFSGLLLAGPVVLQQTWAFVGAGLYRHERRAVKYYAVPGFLLFVAGAALAHGYVMPYALEFLVGWAERQAGAQSLLNVNDYVSLVAFAMFVFGAMFQLPLVMVFLMRVGVVEPATFRRYRRHAIVADLVAAMVLTPPDVLSQLILAGCLIVLYEGAILVGARVARPRREAS